MTAAGPAGPRPVAALPVIGRPAGGELGRCESVAGREIDRLPRICTEGVRTESGAALDGAGSVPRAGGDEKSPKTEQAEDAAGN